MLTGKGMSDEFRIDSHKLLFHPREVAKWLDGDTIYPIYMEISPAGACNHRCTFCALDFMEYRPHFLDTAMLTERLTEMGRLGVKSIMYGGEGEPLLHRDMAAIIRHTKGSGIDVALTTNGVLLKPGLMEQIADSMSWIKVSFNAGTAETYAAVHRTKASDFQLVVDNLKQASQIVKDSGASCTIGAQMILLPENAGEVEPLANICRDIGLRYLVVKPYSQHHKSITHTYEGFDYAPYIEMMERLAGYNDENFRVISRANTMKKMHRSKRGYERCLALPFWSYVDSDGCVWGCSAFLGDERFRYGNLHEESFEAIWTGNKRRSSLDMVATELDPEECRMNCRMDEVNLYLWELTHPAAHANFI
jgi:radical SAM protein with 4Fe4S-binding SPASM domain